MKGQPFANPHAVGCVLGSCLLLSCATVEQLLPITMSNGDVLGLLDTVDQLEIAAARLGQQHASAQTVKAFATRLAQEHATALEERHELADQVNIEPKKPKLALALEEESAKARNRLQKTSGHEFDQAYIANQIMVHQRLVLLLEDVEKSMRQPALRRHVRASGPDLLSHLSAAKAVERQLLVHR